MVRLGRKFKQFSILSNKELFSLVFKELANQKPSLATDSGGPSEWAWLSH